MRKAKMIVQQKKHVKRRMQPQDKHNSKSWQKRNEARSVLQEQYKAALNMVPGRVTS